MPGSSERVGYGPRARSPRMKEPNESIQARALATARFYPLRAFGREERNVIVGIDSVKLDTGKMPFTKERSKGMLAAGNLVAGANGFSRRRETWKSVNMLPGKPQNPV
ncbi:hypothetical protein N7509_014016 [Penicillium cosmopolitanum]|uniref:Uncharacterized protein n=1 Tax=Penicillium cosmopolitanum TaxID=1131564 RepID=A0A9W9S1P0_9EURO|nr:uncharacterized protein N7509_014016 [Penicillium cosmopolitanum]KAJ5369404.1 hypothetical protein N7509_014016 [Penicillium cosmopolitanum]